MVEEGIQSSVSDSRVNKDKRQEELKLLLGEGLLGWHSWGSEAETWWEVKMFGVERTRSQVLEWVFSGFKEQKGVEGSE